MVDHDSSKHDRAEDLADRWLERAYPDLDYRPGDHGQYFDYDTQRAHEQLVDLIEHRHSEVPAFLDLDYDDIADWWSDWRDWYGTS